MNIMIDIETLSSKNNAAIASIGAVAFDPELFNSVEELRQNSFYRVLNIRQQTRYRHFDGDTIYWWLNQSEEAKQAICVDPKDIFMVIGEFSDWYKEMNGDTTWAYGATFDHVVLRSFYETFESIYPVHYRNQSCMRTVTQLSGVKCPEIKELIKHNALDDCIKQTIWLQHCLDKLRGN